MRLSRLGCLLFGLLVVGVWAASADKGEEWSEVRSDHFVVVTNGTEKQARRIARQFELIRAVIRQTLPRTRVDPGGPVIVLAVKDEKSLKALLPEFWEQKGRLHPAGFFVRGPEKNYVAMRLDVPGATAYHTIYHEYVHLLVSLNIPWLPTWLNEGVAEFYGHSVIRDKDVELGRPSAQHLALLRRNRLLPLAVLFAADQSSPYYNEVEKASIFYAQSWALTHFLILGDQTKHNQNLVRFVQLLGEGMDQQEALKSAFADLQDLGKQLELYVGRKILPFARLEAPAGIDEADFTARVLSAAESAAVRGDFHLNNQRLEEARALLDEALRADPNLAAAYESVGFLYFQRGDRKEAAEWLAQAVQLDSRSYLAHYYHATLVIRSSTDPAVLAEAEASLRRAIELNPGFAHAYAALAGLCATDEDTLEEALPLARKAVELEPGSSSHRLTLGNVLLRLGEAEDARRVGQIALRGAKTPEESSRAQAFLEEVQRYEEYEAARKQAEAEARAAREEWEQVLAERRRAEEEALKRQRVAEPGEQQAGGQARARRTASEGKIIEVGCRQGTKLTLTLDLRSYKLELHADDYNRVEFLISNRSPSEPFNPCKHIKGRQARITYIVGGAHPGEIVSVELRQ